MPGTVLRQCGDAVARGKVAEVTADIRDKGEVNIRHRAAAEGQRLGNSSTAGSDQRNYSRIVCRGGGKRRAGERRHSGSDRDAIAAGRQTSEGVVAGRVSDGCAQGIAARRREIDGDAGQLDFGGRHVGGAKDASIARQHRTGNRVGAVERVAEIKPQVTHGQVHRPAAQHDGGGRVHGSLRVVGGKQSFQSASRGKIGRGNTHGPGPICYVGDAPAASGIGGSRVSRAAVGNLDRNPVNPRFAAVLHAILIQIEPNEVTQHHRRQVAEICAGIISAQRQHDPGVSVVARWQAGVGVVAYGHAIAVGVGRLRDGLAARLRQGAGVHLHEVGAGPQIDKMVEAGGIGSRASGGGGCRQRGRAVRHTVTVGVRVELHGYVGNPQLVLVLRAVVVRIEEHKIADGASGGEAEIGSEVVLTRRQSHIVRVGGGRAVLCAKGVGGDLRVGAVDIDEVIASGNTGEEVLAGSICGGGGHHRVSRRLNDPVVVGVLVESDGHTGDAAFTRLFATVAVGVQVNHVTDGAAALGFVAKVHRAEARRQIHDGLAVAHAIVVLRGEHAGGKLRVRRVHHDDVIRSGQAGEPVLAGRTRHGGRDKRVSR